MELKNDFLLREVQRVGKLGIFIYDIKKDSWTSSLGLDELAEISDNYVKDYKGWINTVHPIQRKEMELYANEVLKTGKDIDTEYRAVCKNHEVERWVVAKGKVFFDQCGKPEKIAGIIQDVSELKKSEERYKKTLYRISTKRSSFGITY